jgi:hypothetical protein
MKTFLLMAAGLACYSEMRAQNPRLATDYRATRDAITPVAEAYIGVFRDLGRADAGPPGEHVYTESQVELLSAIKGNGERRIMKCTFHVTIVPDEVKEELPQIGVQYVMVGDPSSGNFQVSKLLTATPENIALVGELFKVRVAPNVLDSKGVEASRPNPPPSVQPSAPKKALAAKPTPPPSEEPTSSTPWSVVAMLIVVAIGLLRLLLKGRK